MGLLDRVKQNQTGVPAAVTVGGNGPATASAAGGFTTASAIPVARPVAPAPSAPPALRPAAGGEQLPAFTAAKVQIHAKLIEKFADQIDSSNKEGVRAKIVELADEYFRSTAMTMTKTDRERLVASVLDDVLGLGPLEALLADATITEIMANHPKQIYVEKAGEPVLSATVFESERQMRQVIDRIVSLVGRRVDESTPICDARLKDGSRVNVVIPPIALKGPCLTIRKFAKEKWGPGDVVNRFRSSSPELMTFLRSCVRARMNILRQDDAAQHPLVLHSGERTPHHVRGRCRAAAAAAALDPARVAPAQRRGQGRGAHPRAGEELPAYAPRSHHRR